MLATFHLNCFPIYYLVILYHIILNPIKIQEPYSASSVLVLSLAAGLRTAEHYGEEILLHAGLPQLWLKSTITIWQKAGSKLRGQQNNPSPRMLCSKYTALQNHKGFLREWRETWIMKKPDTMRRAKEWRSFFHNYLCCSLNFLFENKHFALLNF